MDFLWQDLMHAPFWIGVLQIIFVNIILSGDNAVVIAMACLTLPPKQRLWGMVLGAGVAVLLRVVFTIVIAEAMAYPFLKLVGGALLFYVATKLITEDADGEESVESAQTLWRAVRIVAIADIVMSLDNVIAIAASAENAAAQVDAAHAAVLKATLIVIGLATSVPLIVAGSAILMSLLERYRVLVWGGGALLGWIAGDVMVNDVALPGLLGGAAALHHLHAWGGPVGGLLVLGLGYALVGRHRRLVLDEILAGVALIAWIVVDRFNSSLFGGENPNLVGVWGLRGGLVVALIIAYVIARSLCHVERAEV